MLVTVGGAAGEEEEDAAAVLAAAGLSTVGGVFVDVEVWQGGAGTGKEKGAGAKREIVPVS